MRYSRLKFILIGSHMLIATFLMLAQAATSTEASTRENLSERLYFASIAASGSKLCDRERSARYSKQFNRRYGDRVRALVDYHSRKFGPDPDFIVTTDCIASRASSRQQDAAHIKALDQFAPILQDLEQQFGPPANGS